jgi:hypothetical protein
MSPFQDTKKGKGEKGEKCQTRNQMAGSVIKQGKERDLTCNYKRPTRTDMPRSGLLGGQDENVTKGKDF